VLLGTEGFFVVAIGFFVVATGFIVIVSGFFVVMLLACLLSRRIGIGTSVLTTNVEGVVLTVVTSAVVLLLIDSAT
jgi:hypothetical protein